MYFYWLKYYIGLSPIDAKIKMFEKEMNIFIDSAIQKCVKIEYINYLINIIIIVIQNCNYEY